MITFIKQNKWLAAGVGVVVLALLYYFFFLSGPTSAPLASPTGNDSPVTQNLLVTLSSLHTIKLNGAIFADPVFISLTDFGVVIPTQNVGRRNPFAPLSGAPGQGSAGGGIPIPGR